MRIRSPSGSINKRTGDDDDDEESRGRKRREEEASTWPLRIASAKTESRNGGGHPRSGWAIRQGRKEGPTRTAARPSQEYGEGPGQWPTEPTQQWTPTPTAGVALLRAAAHPQVYRGTGIELLASQGNCDAWTRRAGAERHGSSHLHIEAAAERLFI